MPGLERCPERARSRRTFLDVRRKRVEDDRTQALRKLRKELDERVHLSVANREQHRELAAACEQRSPHEELCRNDASREEVGSLVDLAARHLLRCEVAEFAVGARRGVGLEGIDLGARNAEVGDLHIAVDRDQHIRRADVPMHYPKRAPVLIGRAVHGVQAVQYLAHYIDYEIVFEPLAFEREATIEAPQIAARDIFER